MKLIGVLEGHGNIVNPNGINAQDLADHMKVCTPFLHINILEKNYRDYKIIRIIIIIIIITIIIIINIIMIIIIIEGLEGFS